MGIDRIKFEKPSPYCDKVLVGNWFENLSKYENPVYKHQSTYTTHFTPKPYSANDPTFLWDQKFKSEGLGQRMLIDHGHGEYLENFSTIYDLSYNHFPKCFKEAMPRTFKPSLRRSDPVDEYITNYGNVTKYGLVEAKKEKWHREYVGPRVTGITNYQDCFQPPTKETLTSVKRAIPLSKQFNIEKSVQEERYIQTELPRCNPITWECPTKLVIPTRCVPIR